jgi:hypothetical protein
MRGMRSERSRKVRVTMRIYSWVGLHDERCAHFHQEQIVQLRTTNLGVRSSNLLGRAI